MPKLKRLKVSEVKLDAKNANKGTKRGREFIEGSLKKYGLGRSILLDKDGSVIAGNKTLEAFKKSGGKEIIVVGSNGNQLIAVQREDLKLESKIGRSLAIADNRSSELDLEWDAEILSTLDLKMDDLFKDSELRKILGDLAPEIEAPEPQLDKAEKLRKKWKTARGQIWEIGEHRLMCGDNGSDDVNRLLADYKFMACVSSPPYGDLREYGLGEFDWDSMMMSASNRIFDHCSPQGHVLINLGLIYRERKCEMYWFGWLRHCQELGWPLFGWYVWDKLRAMPGEHHSRLAPAHEFIFHFNKHKGKINKWIPTVTDDNGKQHTFRQRDGSLRDATSPDKIGGEWKIPDSVVRIPPASGADNGHPAMFSPAFADFLIRTWSGEGELIYEPFCGAGTTIASAQLAHRICYGMEIEPKYVAVALERLSEMGLKPELTNRV